MSNIFSSCLPLPPTINLLTVEIAPLIELQVGFDMVYDKDLDKDTQYKDMILFGLTWRWF